MTGPSVRFTVNHPLRVERLILWFPWSPLGADADWGPRQAAHHRKDWQYARRIWADRIVSNGPVALQRAINRAIKNSVTAEVAARRFEVSPHGADELFGDVAVPVLLLERTLLEREGAMYAASRFPQGALRLIRGVARTPYPDHEEIVEAVFDFLDLRDPAEVIAATGHGTAIILFTDVADSTALTTKLGDAAYRERESALDAALRTAIRDAGGSPVGGKLLGDGILSVFASAREAIDAALACKRISDDAELPLHLGIHAGDVIHEGNDVRGGAVQLAARIHDIAAPGEILVSQTVRDLARTSAGVSFADRGEHHLKGIDDPVRVFAVRPSSIL
jgi:class 3 adenylate cyclase